MKFLPPDTSKEDDLSRIVPSTGRLGKFISLVSLGQACWQMYEKATEWYETKRMLTVTVTERDSMYLPVLEWLQKLNPDKSKAVALISDKTYPDGVNGVPGKSKPKVIHNSVEEQKVTINGFKMKVVVKDPENSSSGRPARGQYSRVEFRVGSPEAHSALLEALFELHAEVSKVARPPRLYIPSSYGFTSSDASLVRPLDSVILKEGELEFLVEDLKTFLASEERYTRLGIPWHRGYLLHGIAGTGKTSIAKVIAAHFGLDVYYCPLGDLQKDSDLASLLADIRPRSMWLLEDIDVFSSATSREAPEEDGLSLSGLLNSLDGVATPHGLITIMTTNFKEKLDSAIVRPGRVDVDIEFTALDKDQGQRLFRHFYGFCPENLDLSGLPPAEVAGVFKQHLDDPQSSLALLDAKSGVLL